MNTLCFTGAEAEFDTSSCETEYECSIKTGKTAVGGVFYAIDSMQTVFIT